MLNCNLVRVRYSIRSMRQLCYKWRYSLNWKNEKKKLFQFNVGSIFVLGTYILQQMRA